MKEIDWSKAPAWANVVICAELGAHFWASSWGGQKLAHNIQTGATQYATMYGDHCWHLVASRNDGGWNGEGLPPVGAECEALWSSTPNEVWLLVKVLAHDEGMVLFRWKAGERKGEYSNYSQPYNFRPIRTPEQIAAEEREKAIEALAVELAGHWSSEAVSLQRETAAYLHDIGYRRVEQ